MYNEYAHMNIFDTKTLLFFRFTVTTRSLSTSMAHMAEWVMIPDMTHILSMQYMANIVHRPGKKWQKSYISLCCSRPRWCETHTHPFQIWPVIQGDFVFYFCSTFLQCLFSNMSSYPSYRFFSTKQRILKLLCFFLFQAMMNLDICQF